MKRRGKKLAAFILASILTLPSTIIPVQVKAADRMVADADLSMEEAEEPDSWGALPNEEQLYYMKNGLSIFCHFGPNTFNDTEWGTGYGAKEPGEIFHLKQPFDAEGMVKKVKEAGFSRIILTAKHHDGFCLWDTKLTNYNVMNTDYGRDLLEELSDACTKYNLDMGCYISPWDINEENNGCFGDSNNRTNSKGYIDYNELYIDTIAEIFGAKKEDGTYKYGNNNPNRRSGRFVEWWMDGAQGSSTWQTYDWQRIFDTVKKYEPECQIEGTFAAAVKYRNDADVALASTGGIHWIGNEQGLAADITWAKLRHGESYEDESLFPRPNGSIEGDPHGDVWSVPEADASILNGWFWKDSENEENALRSESYLADRYFRSVGYGAVFLLNLPANKEGKIADAQAARLKQFGDNIKETFDEDYTKAEGVTAFATSVWKNAKAYSPANVLDEVLTGDVYDETYWAPAEGETTGSLEIDFGGVRTFDVVSIEEYIRKGQTISSFSVEYKDMAGQWHEFAKGGTISSKRLCRRSAVEGTAVRINILSAYSTPMINNVGVFKAAKGFEIEDENAVKLPANLNTIPIFDFHTEGEWTVGDDGNSKWTTDYNGSASFTFTGTQAWLFGTRATNHSIMEVFIDGRRADYANTYGERASGQLLYTTPELEYGNHTVKLVNKGNAIHLDLAKYTDGSGIFEMRKTTYELLYGETTELEIVRTAGSHGEVTVTYNTQSSGAEQGVNYVHISPTEVTFKDGETSKKVTVTGLENDRSTDGKDFYVTLVNSASTVSLGENSSARVFCYNLNEEKVLEDCEKLNLDNYESCGAVEFKNALAGLKKCIENGADEIVVKQTAVRAFKAKDALIPERSGNYTAEHPFTFPYAEGSTKTLLAKSLTLDVSETENPDDYARFEMTKDEKTEEETTKIIKFNSGSKIRLPFYAAKQGIYEMTVTYESGRTEYDANGKNVIIWGGKNVSSGEREVFGGWPLKKKIETIRFEVTNTGQGELQLDTDQRGGPNLYGLGIKLVEEVVVDAPVKGVTFSTHALELVGGTQEVLFASVQPADANNQNVIFESSNPSIAEVNAFGVVKGLQEGDAIITVRTEDGGYTDQCRVKVLASETEKPSEIEKPGDTGKPGEPGRPGGTEKPDESKQPDKPEKPIQKEVLKKGKIYKLGKLYYKVLSVKKQTATVVKSVKKTEKSIIIPDMVKLAGVTCKVTQISANAFTKNNKLMKVTIGKNVQVIGKKAFYGIKKLKMITFKGTKTLEVRSKAFSGIGAKCKVKVSKKMPKKTRRQLKKSLMSAGMKSFVLK